MTLENGATEVEEERVLCEVERALHEFDPERRLRDRLKVEAQGAELVIWLIGVKARREVRRIPAYRCRAISAQRLEAAFENTLDAMPVDLADQVRAAAREKGIRYDESPDSDLVFVGVDDGWIAVVHRRLLVDGWPDHDPGRDQ